jgi:putative hydrolase of the HAD superfamily
LPRLVCSAVFLDAGGVIVLPHRGLVGDALAAVGIEIDRAAVPRAHYRAVRELDRDPETRRAPDSYPRALCRALGIAPASLPDALCAMSRLADRRVSDEILWSEPAPSARRTITALGRAGIAVVVVTNSDGHAAENLRDAGICQDSAGSGATVTGVIDSGLAGSAKPDIGIFRTALRRVGLKPASVVHVGDMLCTDVAGAHAAGIAPIHLDPGRSCRAADHRHIRSLNGIWRHVTAG